MPKVVIDPVKAMEKFKADLAAMNVGQKGESGAPRQRMLTKHFGLAEMKFRRWSAELTEAQSLDDAMNPTFWVEQASQLMGHDKANPKGRGDIIEVRKLDTGLYAELLVTEISPAFVRVELVRKAEPVIATIPDDCPLSTRWNVGNRTHEVIRRGDGAVMARGHQTKASAAAWIADHLKAMAA